MHTYPGQPRRADQHEILSGHTKWNFDTTDPDLDVVRKVPCLYRLQFSPERNTTEREGISKPLEFKQQHW